MNARSSRTDRVPDAQLDAILALQCTIAWAGESAGERLGWWKTDLVDPEGGADLFARLVPRTAPWASLALVRAAARRHDDAARAKLAERDDIWTLFHFGFTIDEQLAERLAYHRTHEHVPADVLGAHLLTTKPWSKAGLEALLRELGAPKVETTSAGRLITAKTTSPAEAAALLAAAMLPLPAQYPMPYTELPE
jgi:hypothetical protein